MDPQTKRFVEDLRQLVELAASDIERAQGPLTLEAQRKLRFWLSRAFELGRDYALERLRGKPPAE